MGHEKSLRRQTAKPIWPKCQEINTYHLFQEVSKIHITQCDLAPQEIVWWKVLDLFVLGFPCFGRGGKGVFSSISVITLEKNPRESLKNLVNIV